MQPSSVTVTANKLDPNSQSFTPATPAITPSLATFNQQMVNAKPPALDTITSDTMKGVTPVPLATPKAPDYSSTIATTLADLTNLQNQEQAKVDAKTAEGKSLASSQANLQALLGGKEADRQKALTDTGATAAYNQIQDINAQATGLLNEAKAIPIQVQNEFTGRGATEAGIAPITSARLRDNALKALSLGQQAAIATANYDKAKNYADQIVNAKYDQIQADINAKITNLQALKDFDLSPAQEKARLAREERLNAEKQVNEDKRTTEKQLADMLITASSQGAPSTLLAKAEKELDPARRAMILGEYSGDYYKTQLLKQQIATEKAQRDKYYSDIENSKKELAAKLGTTLPAASAKIEASQSAYDLANELKTLAGKGGAIGFGFKKSVLGSIPFVSPDAIAGTDRSNYEAKFAQLKDTLASANLDKIKGAMSDKDIEFLRNIGTALNPNMSEEAFDTELEKIKGVMAKVPGVVPVAVPNPFQAALGQSTSGISGSSIIEVSPQGDFQFKIPTN